MQYQLPIMLVLGSLLFGYIFILNLQVAHYKNKELMWKLSYQSLADGVDRQNEINAEIAKIGEDMHRLGQKLLKDAQQANTIRQPKINAATARLNSLIKTDCVTAIADAKKELQ